MNIIKAILLLTIFNSCQTANDIPKEYPRMIGDISFDKHMDTTAFQLCNNDSLAVQYYAFTKIVGGKPYLFEKYEMQKIFEESFNSNIAKKETGLIRIRFLVNCYGESGRFRLIGMDKNYKEKVFDVSITNQLLSITKNQLKWKPFKTSTIERDYYMYLIFKMEEGKIIEILP